MIYIYDMSYMTHIYMLYMLNTYIYIYIYKLKYIYIYIYILKYTITKKYL